MTQEYHEIRAWRGEKIKTVVSLSRGTPSTDTWWKSVLESNATVKRWEMQYRMLCKDDKESTLPDSYRVTALKQML